MPTPILSQPLSLGADIVMHSATKYLNGHSDVLAGALCTAREDEFWTRIKRVRAMLGQILGPFEAFLLLRGLRTLDLRVRAMSAAAMTVARHFAADPRVLEVLYPGLPEHPQHELAKRQMSGFGGMISFDLRGDLAAARRFLENVHVFTLAESLGGVESLIEHPAIMTHASVPAEIRASLGISDGFVRVSAGIEHVDDLIADLDAALAKV